MTKTRLDPSWQTVSERAQNLVAGWAEASQRMVRSSRRHHTEARVLNPPEMADAAVGLLYLRVFLDRSGLTVREVFGVRILILYLTKYLHTPCKQIVTCVGLAAAVTPPPTWTVKTTTTTTSP